MLATKSFDGGDRPPFSAKRRHQATMQRLAVHMHRARATVACIAALLHAKPTEIAQEATQALAGARRNIVGLTVDEEAHERPSDSSPQISSANSRVM
jgi:hypothetical protein